MQSQKQRNSNLELYRIILMLLIIAHHYVINSGLVEHFNPASDMFHYAYYSIFGMWGKTAINGFVMITGYYMCQAKITKYKFIKMLLEVEFYNLTINLLFMLTGLYQYTFADFLFSLVPGGIDIAHGFVVCFLIFYLCIPLLNKVLHKCTCKQHLCLIIGALFLYYLIEWLYSGHVYTGYLTWFPIIYLISSYLRKIKLGGSVTLWGGINIGCILIAIALTIFMPTGKDMPFYYVRECNTPLALLIGVSSFMFFKNLKMSYHRYINIVGASTFGVLLIHANCKNMRHWLWYDLLDVKDTYEVNIIYPVIIVIAIFVLCILIDYLRKRYIEEIILERF